MAKGMLLNCINISKEYLLGGGVGVKIELTPLEEIGLSVWGKVAVTGRPLVMVSGGLAGSTNDHLDEIENLDETEETAVSTNEGIGDIEEIIILNEGESAEIYEPHNRFNLKTDRTMSPERNHGDRNQGVMKSSIRKKKLKRTNRLNLNDSAQLLKSSYDEKTKSLQEISNTIFKFANTYEEIEKDRNKIKEKNSTSKFNLQVEPSSSTFKFNLQVQRPSSTFKFNFKFKLQVQSSRSSFKFKLRVEPSSSTFKFKLQVQPSSSNFGLNLQVQPSSQTPEYNLQVQPPSSTSKFDLQVQTSSSTSKFELQVEPSS
ncbi:unnamed protein product [Phaedon cochleariae]|uniref:Uncharacterized protein n=1 Tax=Phaedon cochleariae TaxID=80249 RepID=A0A9N9X2U9_PHACE|nr:unnamed protein product [Phaedon cochleariae]